MTELSDFWSRRRAAVREEAAEEARRSEVAARTAEAEAVDAKSDDEVLAELGLPDPDTLGLGDDFTAFMSRAVPARLRHRALRRLWTSNPTLACLDGLNDYDGDFTATASSGAEVIRTAYQVGRGFLRPAPPEVDPTEVAETEEAQETEPAIAQETEPPRAAPSPPEVAEAATPTRRMRFRFDDLDDASATAVQGEHA